MEPVSTQNSIQYNQPIFGLISLHGSNLGGFLFGFGWVVIGRSQHFTKPFFNITSPADQGWGRFGG